ncbi:DedA family protein [Labedella phragmitis]|nr:VTT domain-containing protein [Labedella phragmitis]
MVAALSAAVEDVVMASVGLPYLLLIVAALCLIDAVFPVVPSESVLIAVATVSVSAVSTGATSSASAGPPLWALVLVAALAAWVGDHLVFHLGRRVGPERWRWMRRARVAQGIGWARAALARRGGLYIVTGRFIPGGRVLVNFVAGSTRYPRGRFAITAGLAAIVWASYSVGIGVFFGTVFDGQPLLAMLVGIVVACVAGLVLDALFGRARRGETITD